MDGPLAFRTGEPARGGAPSVYLRAMRPLLAFVPLLVLAALGAASAQAPTPAAPPPAWAASVEVTARGAPLFAAPSRSARRGGMVRRGTRLAFGERVFGEGCSRGAFVRVGPRRFVCEDHVAPSPEPPGGEPLPQLADGRLLPLQYGFVREDEALLYSHPSDFFSEAYQEPIPRGFGLVITGRAVHEGVRFLRTRRNLYIPASSVGLVRGSRFQGVEIAEGAPLDLAWVLARSAPVLDAPDGRRVRSAGRREVLHVAAVRGAWVELVGGGFVRRAQVRLARPSPPPPEVRRGAKWIDVDVDEQVLVAYEGSRPRFATLVSTGRPRAEHATPKGTFRIWAKLAFSDMNNLEKADVTDSYSIESVPWVQYFEGSNGLHAAFWHDGFGRRRSHGCVNLSPSDARYLFDFTEPVLPPGWEAILPLDGEPSTLVRIR